MNIKKHNTIYVPDNTDDYKIWADGEGGDCWLKPLKDMYVLTEDELKFYLKSFLTELTCTRTDNPEIAEEVEQFIQSITK